MDLGPLLLELEGQVLDLTHEPRVVLDQALLLRLLPHEILVLRPFYLGAQVLDLCLKLTLDISGLLCLEEQILF